MRSAIPQSVSARRTGPYDPPGDEVGNARGGGVDFGVSPDRGAGAGSVCGGVGCGVGGAGSRAGETAVGAGRLMAPPGVPGLAGRVWAGETAVGAVGAGNKTGGS